MNGYDAYRNYLALRLHFTQKTYDFHKFKGKMRYLKPEHYEKHRSKYIFEYLGKKYDKEYVDFITANLIKNYGKSSIFEMRSEKAVENFFNWKKTNESFSYIFRSEIKYLIDKYHKFGIMLNGNFPPILNEILSDKISFQTFCMMFELLNLYDKFDQNLKDDIIWNDLGLRAKKYSKWLPKNKLKYKNLFMDVINSYS